VTEILSGKGPKAPLLLAPPRPPTVPVHAQYPLSSSPFRSASGSMAQESEQILDAHPINLVRDQRDALLRLRGKLSSALREAEAENQHLRHELQQRSGLADNQEQLDEIRDAHLMELESGLAFQHLPTGVYPGRPYVTLQELIQRGVTTYTRQNLSRLTRHEGVLPAVLIADRVLFPPAAVRALVAHEEGAKIDPSPRRRPGRESRRRE